MVIWHLSRGRSKLQKNNKFWYDVLYAWSSYNFFYPKDISDVLKQSLWLNSHITVNKNTLYVAKWYEKKYKICV